MSVVVPGQHVDTAIVAGRQEENVFVGNEIVRHQRAARLIHWSVALSFLICTLSGMPIWTPIFGWMAVFVGGLETARVIHPYAGVLFFITMLLMFFHWLGDMKLEPVDREWFGPKLFRFLSYEDAAIDTGKYNGGQKIFFYAVALGALSLLVSGIIMWFPLKFPLLVRQLGIILHDITFIFFVVGIVSHIYMGTAAEPGTFRAMTLGTVTRAWAKLHHPGWFRDVVRNTSR